jgi:hypothetical protein
MNLPNTTYKNETIEDRTTFNLLPNELKEFFLKCNGLVALNGGIQFKGCVNKPKWISLHETWNGDSKLCDVYEVVEQNDIPIAQDAFGDQYLYRTANIFKLNCESGDLENLNCTLEQFIKNIETDAIDYLSLQQIVALKEMGIELKDGEMMNVYPPFMFNSENERSYKPVPAIEQINYLKNLYIQTKNLEDGQPIKMEIKK